MTKLKIKNIIIINDFDYTQGGASKVAIDTANLLSESNESLNVYFFSGSHSDSSNLNDKIIKVCTNQGEALKDKNKIRGFLNGIYNFKAKGELKKLLKSLDKNNTIIHVHGWTKCLSSSVFDVAFKMKFKVVLTLHDYFTACPNGGYFDYKKNEICHLKPLSWKCIKCNCDSRNYAFKLYRILRQFVQNKIVKLNDRLENVITISSFSEKILKGTLNKNVKIYKVNNPIDFDRSIINKNFKKNDYYLNVSRVAKEKNVEIFCEAVKQTRVKGIVVGDGPEKEKLERKYPMIKFVGWQNSNEVKKYMSKAKYLVFTSKLYEGSPLTTMEALSMGLPCIVYKNCAAVNQIIEGINGYTYENLNELIEIISNKDIKKFEFNYENDYIKDILKCYHNISK